MEEIIMAKLTTAEFIDAIKELSVLELNDLVKACEEEFGVSAAAGVVVAAAGEAAASTLEEMEMQMIRKTLDKCSGNLSAVAAQLGITRQTLYNKMKKYGL